MFFFHLPKKKQSEQSGVCGDRRGQEVNQGRKSKSRKKQIKEMIRRKLKNKLGLNWVNWAKVSSN